MASPQLEKGWTRIANELLEALARADLNGTQFRIMLMLIRESYGKQKLTVKLSYTRLAGLVDQPRTVVGRNLHQLVARQFIQQQGDGDLSEWQIQKDYDRWLGSDQLVTRHRSVTSDQTVTTAKLEGGDQTVTRGSDQLVTQLKKDVKKERNGVEAPPVAVSNGHVDKSQHPEIRDRLTVLGVRPGDISHWLRLRPDATMDDVKACEAYVEANGRPKGTLDRPCSMLWLDFLKAGNVPPIVRQNGHTNGRSPPRPPQPDLHEARDEHGELYLALPDGTRWEPDE